MSPEQVVFAVAGAVCIIGAVVAVAHPAPRPAGAGLIVMLLSLASLCAALAAPAVAIGLIVASLLAVVPLMFRPIAASRGCDQLHGPAVVGAGVLIAASLVAILFLAIVRGEIPVNVSVRSSDGYDVAALTELATGRAVPAVGGILALLVAAVVAALSSWRARRSSR
jgi:NADH:ubiquinone oxidoreductase subunit 6 (subunit J)